MWNFIASLTGYILYKILWDTSFHCTTVVLRVWGKSETQSVQMILTLDGLFQKYFPLYISLYTFQFLLYPWKFHILNVPYHPPLFVFFHYGVCTVISDCNHHFDKSTFTHSLTRIYLLQLKIHIWMELILNQKLIFFHKRNFNPKVINYF